MSAKLQVMDKDLSDEFTPECDKEELRQYFGEDLKGSSSGAGRAKTPTKKRAAMKKEE